jgi:hypothetical protein
VQYAIKASACRREPNSLEAAEPPIPRGRLWHSGRPSAGTGAPESLTKALSGGAASRDDRALPWRFTLQHCVGSSGFHSVGWAAAASKSASSLGPLQRRLGYVAGQVQARGAGGDRGTPMKVAGSWQACRQHSSGAALPNPSLKRSANGGPPGPGRRYAVHFRQPGPGVPPLSPA